ncbi:MAG: methionyl-tRNA formyltransferase [Deltaproteobacteria bacterium]|nr:methionyl-tRNA formyltransferase [Deltaproteobacteria bacterium]
MKQGPWRLIFMGTPQFALPSLEALLSSGEEVLAVVTQPDRPRGRGQQVSPAPVKELALAWNLPVLQPQRLKDPALVQRLADLQPELLVVVAYGRILTQELLALPSVGPLNVHASLLPRHRGAAPINWALIRGDRETGVSLQWMEPELDAGAIFLQERVPILEEDSAGTLLVKLAEHGATLLVQALEKLRRGEAIRKPQPQEGVTYAPPITREMRRLNWQQPAREVAGWIRGLDPTPGAYALWQGKVLKLFEARLKKSAGKLAAPGTVLGLVNQGVEIACGQGSVLVKELQLAGHKRLTAAEFLRGQALAKQVLD